MEDDAARVQSEVRDGRELAVPRGCALFLGFWRVIVMPGSGWLSRHGEVDPSIPAVRRWRFSRGRPSQGVLFEQPDPVPHAGIPSWEKRGVVERNREVMLSLLGW